MRLILIFILLMTGTLASANEPVTVGIEGRLDVLLPTAGLKARPPERLAPLTVRIAFSSQEGASTRYSLRYIGLVPGRHDIRSFLVKEDGSAAEGLPPIEVEIRSILPEGQRGTIIPIPTSSIPRFGGYFWIICGIAVIWIGSAFLVFRARKAGTEEAPIPTETPHSIPERLRPLVEGAAMGRLDAVGKAELERLVIGHWRDCLGLESSHPSDVLKQLKAHPQAGVLLRAVEDWLHRPPGSVAIDLDPLLAVYAPEIGGGEK